MEDYYIPRMMIPQKKYTYDSNNNVIARENSTGYWIKYETDSYGHITYSIDSDGNYTMSNYIGLGNQSRYEAGTLIDGIKTVELLEYKFYDADWNEIGYYLFPENTSEIFDQQNGIGNGILNIVKKRNRRK